MKLTDTRGLHIDEDACMVRVQEMISDVRREYELKEVKFWHKCEETEGTQV